MTGKQRDPRLVVSGEIPEADLVDQLRPIGPYEPVDDDTEPGIGGGDDLISEADRLDQAVPLAGDDEDDYPHDRIEVGDL
ncbi:MAG: hypothetical protein ABI382_02180 [Nakamurella sp.]